MNRPSVFAHDGKFHIEPRGREGERCISLTPEEAVDVASQLVSYITYCIDDDLPLYLTFLKAQVAILNLKIEMDERKK